MFLRGLKIRAAGDGNRVIQMESEWRAARGEDRATSPSRLLAERTPVSQAAPGRPAEIQGSIRTAWGAPRIARVVPALENACPYFDLMVACPNAGKCANLVKRVKVNLPCRKVPLDETLRAERSNGDFSKGEHLIRRRLFGRPGGASKKAVILRSLALGRPYALAPSTTSSSRRPKLGVLRKIRISFRLKAGTGTKRTRRRALAAKDAGR